MEVAYEIATDHTQTGSEEKFVVEFPIELYRLTSEGTLEHLMRSLNQNYVIVGNPWMFSHPNECGLCFA